MTTRKGLMKKREEAFEGKNLRNDKYSCAYNNPDCQQKGGLCRPFVYAIQLPKLQILSLKKYINICVLGLSAKAGFPYYNADNLFTNTIINLKMMRKRLLLAGSLCIPLLLFTPARAADPVPVRFVNKGKMTVAPHGTDNTSLHIPYSLRMKGNAVNVLQNGKTLLQGDFFNDVTAGNVFDNQSAGWIWLRNSSRMQSIAGTADRAKYFIDFPNILVENPFSVELVSSMGMSVNDLDLSQGKFVLRSKVVGNATDRTSRLAHLLVKEGGSVSYNRSATDVADKGVIEVELALDGTDSQFFGFSSPFKELRLDYFIYNFITKPSKNGLFGDAKATITDPRHTMKSGEGYLFGQGVFQPGHAAYTMLAEWESAQWADRIQEMMRLNRYWLKENSSLCFLEDGTAYTGEEIQTESVTNIPLVKGFNYLGNPFTCPLSMSSFVNTTGVADDWKIKRSDTETPGANTLFSQYWVLNTGKSVDKSGGDMNNKTFQLTASYLVGQKEGSTLDMKNWQIEPMQLFVVYSLDADPTTLTIPLSARTHGNEMFLRSSPVYVPTDELLIQVTDQDTKAFDRMCVVFREGASINFGDPYDAEKLFNRSGGVSQVYYKTAGTTPKSMSVNVVNANLEAMPVCFTPCSGEKQVVLSASRLETLVSPEGVWLEDLREKEMVNLTTQDYLFTSSPLDSEDRFVLHFKKVSTGMKEYPVPALQALILQGELTLRSLSSDDEGSAVVVSDIQGRIILNERITATVAASGNCSSQSWRLPVSNGVYIVKVSGKRNLTAKLIAQ